MRKRCLPGLILALAFVSMALAQRAQVAITGVFPDSGPPGTLLTIRGHGFALGDPSAVWAPNLGGRPAPGMVSVGGCTAEIRLWEDGIILAMVPEGAVPGPVVVTMGSRIEARGNHFEVTTGQEREGGRKRQYAFEEESHDLYGWPSAGYMYFGCHPRPRRQGGWNFLGQGVWDSFTVSGPLLAVGGIFSGMDQLSLLPRDYPELFRSRADWWDANVEQPRRKYRFEE